MTEHNGSPNRETYAIALVLENDESYMTDVIDLIKQSHDDVDTFAKALKTWVIDEVQNVLCAPTIRPLGKEIIDELLDMDVIDWDFIAESFIESYAEVDETEDMTD